MLSKPVKEKSMNPHHQTVRWLRDIMSQLKTALIVAIFMGWQMPDEDSPRVIRDTFGVICGSLDLTLFLALLLAWGALKIYEGKKSPWG
ncbi:MAG: hypothetical protein COU32_03895 [Candidatus Magasanikbacteria bacterium CG10_big_fil_rev_8_21_14_0_10_42_10]|uniref:Uncharacterized protein n=2 Tax=Candidatus Magasanikiibacteriota TaxID=1752731 RepID=A0A2H0TV84_9BACT|nr:MAG: hypothetical protein COU32_03895 [Candidatus Magasanikbacteria bacterium CG10_big_fil_rev_8_21_14_0_10_42_10]PIZ94279.1 MAG: hypothetical protein COX82_00840 [Candidatus Magasanikbacteria bacterium CG_4_10_14_0_2_um_filter_41_10]